MRFSERELTAEEIIIADRDDKAAHLDGRMFFLILKYEYITGRTAPITPHMITIDKADRVVLFEGDTAPVSIEDYIMPHGGYYAVIKECIARKKTWEELLNAEPYLTWLKEEQVKEADEEEEYDDEDRFPFYELCDEFPDYFNCKELQAGFTLNELKKDDPSAERILRAIELYDEDFLLKCYPDIYHEGKEIHKLGQQQWEEQYRSRIEAKQKALGKIYLAAKKFFLENDELPPKPLKGAGAAWLRA